MRNAIICNCDKAIYVFGFLLIFVLFLTIIAIFINQLLKNRYETKIALIITYSLISIGCIGEIIIIYHLIKYLEIIKYKRKYLFKEYNDNI